MHHIILIDARPLHVTAGPLPSPYGLEIIKAHLADLDIDVKIFNPFLFADMAQAIRAMLSEKSVLLIGISIRNIDDCITLFNRFDKKNNSQIFFFLDKIKDMVAVLKSIIDGRIPIVAGGIGFSAAPEHLLSYLDLAYGVTGPGEHTLRQAARSAIKGEFASSFKKLPGAVVREGNRFIKNPNTYQLSDEKSMPLVREQFYFRYMRTLPIRIGVGCPLRCRHCVEPLFAPISLRPVENVISELRSARNHHPAIKNVMFADSELNLIREDYLCELFRRIIAEKLHHNLSFTAYFNMVPFSDKLLKYLQKLNFTVALTMDHAKDDILENIGKNYRRKHIVQTFRKLSENKLRFTSSLLFGHPEETEQSICECLDFLKTLPNAGENIIFTSPGLRLYPNTPLARTISPDDQHLYGHGADGFVTPCVYCKPFDPMTMADYLEQKNEGCLKLVLMADLPFLNSNERCQDVSTMFENSIRGLFCQFNNENDDAIKYYERILASKTKYFNPMFRQILVYMLKQYTKSLHMTKISHVLQNYISYAVQRLIFLKSNL